MGDLAYELDREVREHELYHAGESHREPPQRAPQVRSLAKPLVREKQNVSIIAVLGFMVVIALATLVLFSYVQLTEISTSVVELQSQLDDLQTENVTLTAQYEKMYDLSTVKEVAESAGMNKPTGSQIYYIDLSDGDSAVVYQKENDGLLHQLTASLSHGVYAVVEYFD
jgi:cell division protein FtsL